MKLWLSTLAIMVVTAGLTGCGGTRVETDAGQPAVGSGVGGSTGSGGATGIGGSPGAGGSIGTGGSTTVADAAGPPTCGVIRASDYDQSCTNDSDCVAVFEGDTCTTQCGCENAAINRRALASYNPVYSNGKINCPCAFPGLPTCVGGVCKICPVPGCPAKDGGVHD